MSRMFGSDCKVSLHSTGDCQFSATDSWVTRIAGRRNADRHMTKWSLPRPIGSAAAHVFQVRIPETELRVSEVAENLAAVRWLSVPPQGHTVSLECYFTPISENDPALTSKLPCPHLFSLHLADGRWFTVLHNVPPLDGKDLQPMRNQMNARARTLGIEPRAEQRGCLYIIGGTTERGLIELCTVGV